MESASDSVSLFDPIKCLDFRWEVRADFLLGFMSLSESVPFSFFLRVFFFFVGGELLALISVSESELSEDVDVVLEISSLISIFGFSGV